MSSTLRQPPFLLWYDDAPKRTLAQKVADACDAYRARFGVAPTLVLVSTDDAAHVDVTTAPAGVELRVVATVRRNTVWAGQA